MKPALIWDPRESRTTGDGRCFGSQSLSPYLSRFTTSRVLNAGIARPTDCFSVSQLDPHRYGNPAQLPVDGDSAVSAARHQPGSPACANDPTSTDRGNRSPAYFTSAAKIPAGNFSRSWRLFPRQWSLLPQLPSATVAESLVVALGASSFEHAAVPQPNWGTESRIL